MPEPNGDRHPAPFRLDVVMTNATQRGGAERFLQLVCRHGGDGLRLRLAFLEDGPMVAEAESLGIPAAVFRAPRFRDLVGTLRTIRSLRSWMREGEPDLVMGWMKKAHLYSGPASLGIAPAAWFQHENPGSAPIDRVIHRIPAAGIACCSDFVREAQRSVRPGIPCRTVHPCQDVANEPDTDVAWPVPAGRTALVAVSRLQSWKGIHLVLDAMVRLRERGRNDIDLVVVGGQHDLEPDYPAFLRSRIAELGLGGVVHLAGFQPDPASWMRRSRVVVHASREEPFGMVVAEAIALGIPVVAARPGGPDEIVRPDEGRLWEHPDIGSLASAIEEALSMPRRAPAPDRFSAEASASELESAVRAFARSAN